MHGYDYLKISLEHTLSIQINICRKYYSSHSYVESHINI